MCTKGRVETMLLIAVIVLIVAVYSIMKSVEETGRWW